MIQYGPRSLFPRTRIMPAGPASADAAVVTCVYLGATERAEACERLFLEALADLQAREVVAVEAFALNYPDDVPLDERFDAHHTVFDRAFLERLGFVPIRSSGARDSRSPSPNGAADSRLQAVRDGSAGRRRRASQLLRGRRLSPSE